MGNYRKPNAWLNLLHRPIAHRRLALALMLAAAMLLALGILLPALLTAGWQEGMTARVLDARHLLLALSAWLLACIGYLVGAYAMLANRRYAVAGFVFLFGLLLAAATGPGVLLLQGLALAWLAAMVLASFKPDLAAPPRDAKATLVLALPLQLAMWCALLVLSIGQEFLWIAMGTHPNNPAVPVVGSVKEADGFSSGRVDGRRPARQHIAGSAAVARAGGDLGRAPGPAQLRAAAASQRAWQPGADGVRRRHAPRALGLQPRRHALPWAHARRTARRGHARRARPGAVRAAAAAGRQQHAGHRSRALPI
jgi:hypothetical protein